MLLSPPLCLTTRLKNVFAKCKMQNAAFRRKSKCKGEQNVSATTKMKSLLQKKMKKKNFFPFLAPTTISFSPWPLIYCIERTVK